MLNYLRIWHWVSFFPLPSSTIFWDLMQIFFFLFFFNGYNSIKYKLIALIITLVKKKIVVNFGVVVITYWATTRCLINWYKVSSTCKLEICVGFVSAFRYRRFHSNHASSVLEISNKCASELIIQITVCRFESIGKTNRSGIYNLLFPSFSLFIWGTVCSVFVYVYFYISFLPCSSKT